MGEKRERVSDSYRREEGAITGPLGDGGAPTRAWTPPPYGGTNARADQAGYVPPELRPQGGYYAPPDGGGQNWTPQPQPPPPTYRQSVIRESRPHRTPILGPVLLILSGVLFLLNTLDIVDWSVWGQLWRLWPLVLIALGLDLLLGRRNPFVSLIVVLAVLGGGAAYLYSTGGFKPDGPPVQTQIAVPVEEATSAGVEIDFGAGKLNISGGMGDQLLAGTIEHYENRNPPEPVVSREGDKIELRLDQSDGPSFQPFNIGDHDRLDWDLTLNSQLPTDLDLNVGASQMVLDLEKTQVTQLNLDVGASDIRVIFPANVVETKAKIDAGAAKLDLTIPEGVAARIEVDASMAADIKVNTNRFEKISNELYESDGYSRAAKKLLVNIDAGAASIDIP